METKSFTCDVCGELVDTDHDKLFMVTVTATGKTYQYDGGTNGWSRTFHAHNSHGSKCWLKIAKLFSR